MHRDGHYGTAFIATGLLILVFPVEISLPVSAGLLACTLLPDKDQVIPFVKHRGFSHTVWFALLFGALITVGVNALSVTFEQQLDTMFGMSVLPINYTGLSIALGIGSTLGICIHIFTDTLTVGSGYYGIKPFWPVSTRQVRFGFCTADNTTVNSSLFALGAMMVVLIGWVRLKMLSGPLFL